MFQNQTKECNSHIICLFTIKLTDIQIVIRAQGERTADREKALALLRFVLQHIIWSQTQDQE